MPNPFDIQSIRPEQTHHLRHTVLRQYQRLSEMVYDGDDLPGTLHLGAFLPGEELLVGVVTLNDQPMPIAPEIGDWRLRGMAVAASAQGTGVGRRLVELAIADVTERGGRRLWCNARVSAMGFYCKFGFETIGERFDIPHIGPHYVMHVAVGSASR